MIKKFLRKIYALLTKEKLLFNLYALLLMNVLVLLSSYLRENQIIKNILESTYLSLIDLAQCLEKESNKQRML